VAQLFSLAKNMRAFVFSLLWLASVILAFIAGARITTHQGSTLTKEFDTFRRLYGESKDSGLNWLSDPRCCVFGRFVLMRPKDNNIPGLYVALTDKQPFPSVMIQPSSDNKRPEVFSLRDKDGNTVTVEDKKKCGIFDSLFLQTGSITRMDRGLTGTWNRVEDTSPKK